MSYRSCFKIDKKLSANTFLQVVCFEFGGFGYMFGDFFYFHR